MKCVKSGDVIKRVNEDEASTLVKSGWEYCPKSQYKAYKGIGKPTNVVEDENVVVKKKTSWQKKKKS